MSSPPMRESLPSVLLSQRFLLGGRALELQSHFRLLSEAFPRRYAAAVPNYYGDFNNVSCWGGLSPRGGIAYAETSVIS